MGGRDGSIGGWPGRREARPWDAFDQGSAPNGNGPENDETLPEQGLITTGATGLEPATSGVTGRRSNQLSYAPFGVGEG
jgi:hypothetical protein